MPWKERSVVEERMRFVLRRKDGESMASLCREFGINRLRSDELPRCWAKSHCSGAFVQRLCNQKCDGFCGPFVEPLQKLSIPEAQLYKAVTDNVREGFNRAYALANEKRAGTVGFALTILQRRLQAIEVGVVS